MWVELAGGRVSYILVQGAPVAARHALMASIVQVPMDMDRMVTE